MSNSSQLDRHRDVTSIIADRAFPLMLETYLYALYTVLTVYFLYRRWLDRKTTSLPVFMLFVTISMFILYSGYWAIDVYLLWIEIYRYLPQLGTVPGIFFLDGILIPWSVAYYVQTALEFAMLVLGDTVSLWRAYVIWGRPRWLFMLFLGTTVIESIAYVLVLVALFAQNLPQSPHGFSYSFFTKAYIPLCLVSNIITACAQLFATIMIMYKGWVYWRDVRKISQQARHGIAMLTVFIETSVVYFFFLLWLGFVGFFANPNTLLYAWVFYYTTPLIAMYPTLVVVIAATRRSVLENSAVSEHVPSGLHFATNPSAQQNRGSQPSRFLTYTQTEIRLGASLASQRIATHISEDQDEGTGPEDGRDKIAQDMSP
ncbi:unnamed protein product [Peniophora sp. CBMAI 1063]|nr:unnamed protein product [Peniophora sp. CBMAI 1063]